MRFFSTFSAALATGWVPLLTGVCLTLACAGPENAPASVPKPPLAESRSAQSEFRTLSQAWHQANPEARAKLEPAFRRFLALHGADGAARMARVYLAWILSVKGQLVEAKRLIEQTRRGPEGVVKDFGTVVEAALLIEHNRPQEAVKSLRQLQGKIIDPTERFLATEQLVIATMAARLYAESLLYMLDWITQAPPDQEDDVRASIESRLHTVAPAVLRRSLPSFQLVPDEQAAPGQSRRAVETKWLYERMSQQLVELALSSSDADLARELVATSPTLAEASSGGDLVRLATGGVPTARISGRAVGFVMHTADAVLRRRTSQVANGLAVSVSGRATLLSAEDDGSKGGTERAFVELASQGASVVVAGLDQDSAAAAARAAAHTQMPTFLLFRQAEVRNGFSFTLGLAPADEVAALGRALKALDQHSEFIFDEEAAYCRAATLPIDDWRAEGVASILVLNDGPCARRLVRECRRDACPLLALGLEANHQGAAPKDVVMLQAGGFPWRNDDEIPSSEDATTWVTRVGRPPAWFEALGHDAAALALLAMTERPDELITDPGLVVQRHENLSARIRTSTAADLWTSTRGRFNSALELERELEVR